MAEVIAPFRDRETWAAYDVGDSYDGTPGRISELSMLGLVRVGLIAHDARESDSETPSEAHSGNLDDLTVPQLRELADERGVAAPRRATKPQLLALLGA